MTYEHVQNLVQRNLFSPQQLDELFGSQKGTHGRSQSVANHGTRKNKRKKRNSRSVSIGDARSFKMGNVSSDSRSTSSKSSVLNSILDENNNNPANCVKCLLCGVEIQVTQASDITDHEISDLHKSKTGVNVHETLYKCFCCNMMYSKTDNLIKHLNEKIQTKLMSDLQNQGDQDHSRTKETKYQESENSSESLRSRSQNKSGGVSKNVWKDVINDRREYRSSSFQARKAERNQWKRRSKTVIRYNMSVFRCRACHKSTSDWESMRDHVNTSDHDEEFSKLRRHQKTECLSCVLCDVHFKTIDGLKEHAFGRRHMGNVEKAEGR